MSDTAIVTILIVVIVAVCLISISAFVLYRKNKAYELMDLTAAEERYLEVFALRK